MDASEAAHRAHLASGSRVGQTTGEVATEFTAKALTKRQVRAILKEVGSGANPPWSRLRALRRKVFLNVASPPEKTPGGIILPSRTSMGSHLWDPLLGSKKVIVAPVLAIGEEAAAKLRPAPELGALVMTTRFKVGWITRRKNGHFICFTDYDDLLCLVD